ncbi:MAG: hypothetical protein KC635_25655 [Myxococcales bacterium]|nr:hypothetical protein [Myxococcales bacterium]
MAAPEAVTAAPGAPAKGSGVGLLMRLFWMFFGNIALIGVAGLLFRDDGEQLVELSVLYWVVVGAIIGSRWLDIFRFGGRTTEGEPATPAHLKKHATVLVPLALVVWAVAAFG